MRITYNAPVTLTFALLSALVLVVDQITGSALTERFFSIGGAITWADPLQYLRLFTHVIGHANWTHLLSNFAFILLLGPILEEKYGSGGVLIMMLIVSGPRSFTE